MESPYLQFLIGLSAYQAMSQFDPSMMVHFRRRIGSDLIKICCRPTQHVGQGLLLMVFPALQRVLQLAPLTPGLVLTLLPISAAALLVAGLLNRQLT